MDEFRVSLLRKYVDLSKKNFADVDIKHIFLQDSFNVFLSIHISFRKMSKKVFLLLKGTGIIV